MSYHTFSQSIRSRGDEYMARGDAYAAAGNIPYAEGCWRKAKRKYDKANEFERIFSPKSAFEAHVHQIMADAITRNLYA